MSAEYHKIPGPFKRHAEGPDRNKLIPWDWSDDALAYLSESIWTFTEKIDGTNIRIIWDGHKPEFRGRTDRAQIPGPLATCLQHTFTEELLEQTFGSQAATLYGEGYGAGIQKGGGNYRPDQSFALFDVLIGGWWLKPEDVAGIGDGLGIGVAPQGVNNTLRNEIIWMTKNQMMSGINEDVVAEGCVGKPIVPLLRRDGSRIVVKLKTEDLFGLEF